jgi:predicted amidohydrolase
MKITLGLVQMGMAADAAENRKRAIQGIKDAARRGANIICLPELFTSPYFPQDERSDADAFSETVPGQTTEALSAAAKENKAVVIAGSIYEKDGKKLYNTAVVFDEAGKILGKYRKMHIPHDPNFFEQDYFAPGDLGYKVFETKYGRIAVLICYDQWFPEAARIVSLMGADMIFYPTAIGTVAGVEQAEGSWQDAWETVQRGHAIANGVAVAAINRAGGERKMKFWGGSFVSSQFGTLLAKAGDKDEVVIAEVDLSLGKAVKEGWRFFHNRRPNTYSRIIQK